jgi:hypothetical protein
VSNAHALGMVSVASNKVSNSFFILKMRNDSYGLDGIKSSKVANSNSESEQEEGRFENRINSLL